MKPGAPQPTAHQRSVNVSCVRYGVSFDEFLFLSTVQKEVFSNVSFCILMLKNFHMIIERPLMMV